jgi:hypothetical protein
MRLEISNSRTEFEGTKLKTDARMTGLEELEPRSRPTPLKYEFDAPNEMKPLAVVTENPGRVRRRMSPLDSSTMF